MNDLMKMLSGYLSSEPAVSTRTSTALGKDFLANDKENIGEGLAKFLSNAIATSPGTAPEETAYGRAIIDMMRDYGNPIINEIDVNNAPLLTRKIFNPSDEQKLMVKKWQEQFGKEGRVKFGKTKYYDPTDNNFYEIVPRPTYSRSKEYSEYMKRNKFRDRPATLNVKKGNVDDLLAELSHHVQYLDLIEEEKRESDMILANEQYKYGDSSPTSRGVYGIPDTGEYEAHQEIEPQLIDEFKSRLDSYLFKDKSAMNVEDLFKF